jgi:hypothetical protein
MEWAGVGGLWKVGLDQWRDGSRWLSEDNLKTVLVGVPGVPLYQFVLAAAFMAMVMAVARAAVLDGNNTKTSLLGVYY